MRKLWVVAAILVVWISVVGRNFLVERSRQVQQPILQSPIKAGNEGPKFRVVRFTTACVDETSYRQFMDNLRDVLRSGEPVHGIPRMRDPNTVSDVSDRFILVELVNEQQQTVTLAIDALNLYVVAYQAGQESFFFNDAPDVARENVFLDTRHNILPYDSTYGGLERAANRSRQNIELGIAELDNAITTLFNTNPNASLELPARAAIIAIQMVSEAARFRYIEGRVRVSIRNQQCFLPDMGMLSLVQNWDPLSENVQGSNEGGTFPRPVQLQNRDGSLFDVGSVTRDLVAALALMLFKCTIKPPLPPRMLPRPYTWNHLPSWWWVGKQEVYQAGNGADMCEYPEPRVRISGRDGLCVDVTSASYNNGNSIILYPCKSNSDENQFWTFKADKTIRSNDKCLTTYGYSPGCYVMIYDCALAVPEATRWDLKDDGTIINPRSSLVLTATSGASGTTLTVESNSGASSQGWLASTNPNPFTTTIVGFKGLCLETDGSGLWVDKCLSEKAEQRWSLYSDGTIRPQTDPKNCVAAANCVTKGCQIVVKSCSGGDANQRWMFQNDATIYNLKSGLVMGVSASKPELKQIILWPNTANADQKWLLLP